MSWRRILLLSTLFAIALGIATWTVLQRSDAATAFVRRELAARCRTPVELESTELDLAAGRLSVRGLRLGDPTRPGTTLLAVEQADLDVDVEPLGASWSLRALTIAGVSLDLGPKLPTLPELLHLEGDAGAAGDTAIPAVAVTRATVRYTPSAGGPAIELTDVALHLAPVHGEPRRLSLRGSGVLTDLAAPVHLAGEVDLAAGTTHLTARLRDSAFDRTHLQRLERQLGIDLRSLDAAARIRELDVHCRATFATPDRPRTARIEVTGELTGLRASAPGLPRQIRSADVAFCASSDRSGDLRASIVQHDDNGHLELWTEIEGLAAAPSWSVRANGRDLVVNDDAVDALRLFPLGADLMTALQPRSGRADIEIYLRDPHLRSGVAEFDMTLREVAMAYHGFGEGDEQIGFPVPLVDASGTVRLRDDIVLLEGLDASIAPAAGGGKVKLDGRIETKAPAGEDTTLDIHATGVLFSSHLREALMALQHDEGALYDRLSPAGRADVDVHVRPRQQLDGGWALTVRPLAATMSWGGFPYRVDGLSGTVVARRAGVEFDLGGTHGGGTLTLQGHIPLSADSPDGIEGFEAVVDVKDLAVDDELRAAVAVTTPMLDAPWRQSRPNGRLGGRVKVWRPSPTEPLHHDVQLELAGVSLDLPVAPWRANGLTGQVFAQGAGDTSRLDFDALRGTLEHGSGRPAQLAMLGTLGRSAAVTDDLAFVVRGLELDATLGATLEQLGALGPGAWASLRPSGTVDLVCRHSLAADGQSQLRLVVQLVDVASDAPMLPRPARRMTGELQVADGVLSFEDVRADLGGALVRCNRGRIVTRPEPDGRTDVRFTVSATGFPVDGGLANLFTGPLQRAIAERRLQGRADVDELQLQFLVPPPGSDQPLETGLSGQLRLHDVAIALGTGAEGIRLEHVNGVVGLDPCRVTAGEGQLTGMLRQASLRVFGQPFEAIEGRFVADAKQLALTSLTSRLHGGQVRAASTTAPPIRYTLPHPQIPDGRLAADLAFERIDVFAFLRECGWVNPPYSGDATGQLHLEQLDGYDVVDARGAGELTIDRGDLGAVPLFTAIYSQLPAPERPRFDHLASKFRLADRRVDFDTFSLRSNLLAANGSGSLKLDGYLDVELKLDNLLGPSADPVVMPFVDFLTKNIVRFHLFGHLRDLRAEKRWVTERSPDRRSVPPMAPLWERPAIADF